MPVWLWAGIWGFVAGSALLVGAAVGYFVRLRRSRVAAIMAFGGGVRISALANIPEGLSSAAGMRAAGRSVAQVAAVWASIAVASGLAALVGYVALRAVSPDVIAGTTAVAAGAMLAMIADTMIPEAFEEARDAAGLVTVLGFLAAFVLTKLGG